MPRVPIASGGAPECRPSTLDTPPRAAARHPDGCGATARNTSLVRPTGSPHRWVSSLRRPRAPQRRVRASWPRLASEQGCLRAARPGVLALGVLAPRTFVCAHEGTGSSHLPRARFVVHERLSAGCAPYGRAWRLSRAACGQPDRVFWLWVFWLHAHWCARTRALYLAIFSWNCSPDFFFVTKEKKEKKTSPTQKKNETILAA